MAGSEDKERRPGVGLALSGGGFRATLFHIGALWRLNELGYLPKPKEVTSVSGGSITVAALRAYVLEEAVPAGSWPVPEHRQCDDWDYIALRCRNSYPSGAKAAMPLISNRFKRKREMPY